MHNSTYYPNHEVLFICTYPPRECGIASYSNDLIEALKKKFSNSFSIRVCALDTVDIIRSYPDIVKYKLKSQVFEEYAILAEKVNRDESIKMVIIQHEFGLFGGEYGNYLLQLIYFLEKPVSITFHTVLPFPNNKLKKIVQAIASACDEIIVMTRNSAAILMNEYTISGAKILIIPHGTHIVPWKNKLLAKAEYQLQDKLLLSTFGLLGPNKSIETALEALPGIIKKFPNVLYLIIGRTHPEEVESKGEAYREFLKFKIQELGIQENVQFVNRYLNTDELLEYLRITDIYLFTSKDPYQTVSGSFAYAMSSACPVISTPIPHALEMLKEGAGVIVNFQDSENLGEEVNRLLSSDHLREELGRNAFHQTRYTVWENTSILHANIFCRAIKESSLIYNLPEINLSHLYALTDSFGIIQFSDFCEPEISSGYTLDDNARALIAVCMHFDLTKERSDLTLIKTYLDFIGYCQMEDGSFLNYVDSDRDFDLQNEEINLSDSNGRAIWALGVLISYQANLPDSLVEKAKTIMDKSLPEIWKMESPRGISFVIKGLYNYHKVERKEKLYGLIDQLSMKLIDKYNLVSDANWNWFEDYLTYANSSLPEAMLYAYLVTNKSSYKIIAHMTFEFLLSHLFVDGSFRVISNSGWFQKGLIPERYGEQPIDVSYTIQALNVFYQVFDDINYLRKMDVAFAWFLGNNHLGQIMYNPVTGGCYDGLEEFGINLNQGAESTVCYIIARLIMQEMDRGVAENKPINFSGNKKRNFAIHAVLENIHRQTKKPVPLMG